MGVCRRVWVGHRVQVPFRGLFVSGSPRAAARRGGGVVVGISGGVSRMWSLLRWLRLFVGMLVFHVSRVVGRCVRFLRFGARERPLAHRVSVLSLVFLPCSLLLGSSLPSGVSGGGFSSWSPSSSAVTWSSSRYVTWMTGDTVESARVSRALGCRAAGRGESGPLVLAFGRQVDGGGTRGFAGPGVLRTYAEIASVVAGYRDGLSECGAVGVLLVAATSNYALDDVSEASMFGAAWASLVSSIGSRAGVEVAGGVDLEPGWGSLAAGSAWVAGFRSSGLALYSNASADGCPLSGAGGACANGWDTFSLASLVWGGDGAAIPQVYRRDGAQAHQWAVLARQWAAYGGVPRFVAVMSQRRACGQVDDPDCPGLSQSPVEALEQLRAALDGVALVPGATDVGWG